MIWASSHLGQGVDWARLGLPLAVLSTEDAVVEGRDSGGVAEHGGGGVADRSSGDNGSVSSSMTSVQEGQGTSVSLTSGHLAKGVGLGLPLAVLSTENTVVEGGDSGGVAEHGGGGVADNRSSGDNGSVSGSMSSVQEGQGTSVSLASGHLAKGVGLGLPLAVVDAMVESGNGVS